MAIDYDKLVNRHFDEVRQSYDHSDTILYALGVGVSMDPMDEDQLCFTYEEGLAPLPTMAVCWPPLASGSRSRTPASTGSRCCTANRSWRSTNRCPPPRR